MNLRRTLGRDMRARTLEEPTITFLDVGQGDSILIRSGRHAALIDGGGRSDDARFGEGTLLPLLVDRGVRDFDFVALTAVLTTVSGAILAFVEASRYDFIVSTYRATPQRLRDEETSTPSGATPPSPEWSSFVDRCERILQEQNNSWVAKFGRPGTTP